jgi:cytochrome P450
VEEIQLKFRRDCVRGAFIPFNAHTRKCLGQGFVLLEMKIVLFELVRRVRWRVDPSYTLKLPGVGTSPFLLTFVAEWISRVLTRVFTGWGVGSSKV